MKKHVMLLQWFAEAGTVVNAMPFYVNAYTGDTTPFTPGSDDLGPLDKTFYQTDMLDNTRDQMIYGQLGMKQTLPANHGTSIEWTRWNTLGRIGKLKEGVIPTGKKMGIVAITVLTIYPVNPFKSILVEKFVRSTETSASLKAYEGRSILPSCHIQIILSILASSFFLISIKTLTTPLSSMEEIKL